eukprot:82868_1
MPPPASKKRKLNRHITARENADNLIVTDKYDVERWMHIISRADKEASLEDQRHILSSFLDIFPTSARQWKYYIEIEMYHKNYNIATELFKKCINNKCYDVELYEVYIALCQKINEASVKDLYLKNLNDAYKFATKQIGQDIKSTSLWRKYLTFLKSNSTVLCKKHDIEDITLEIRKVYQSLIKLPIEDCDKLWDDYISWEKSLNPQLAQAFYDQLKHHQELTKRCYLDRKRWRRGILLHIHTVPSNNQHAQERNYQQIQLWKRFIDYELLNKQNLNTTDLWRRMEFTFRQSLMTMSLFPDIWLMYIEWTQTNRGNMRTQLVYKQCLQRIPNCLLIQFKYLEFVEKHQSVKEADAAYLDLLQHNPDNTLVYIQYLYFLRRCQSTAAARNFFIQTIQTNASKFWQLYVALGYIEEHMNNDGACAQRIFENGFKYFKDKPEFVICYVQFLMNKKDQQSKNELRQIFDNILPQFSANHKDAKEIWKMYIKFEQRSCDLQQLHMVEEKRNNEQHCNRIEILLNSIERFSFLDLLPVSQQYRDTLIHAKQTTQRKKTQKLNAMHSNVMGQNAGNLHRSYSDLKERQRRKHPSRIKIHAFQYNTYDDEDTVNAPFVDMSSHIQGKGGMLTMPDLEQMVAFRPGIRFLQKLCDDEQKDEGKGDKSAKNVLPPKIKELLEKLPPPQHTQLLRVDKTTSMVDIESFLTFMKLRLSSNDDVL